MRKPVIAGNWKLFKNRIDTASFINELKPLVSGVSDIEIIIAPVFTSLETASKLLEGCNIKLAAQDCFWQKDGAFTGEISPPLLKDCGCSSVIIGHSERREYFGETDEAVNKKIFAATDEGLSVLFCIGETLKERESGKTFEVLDRQVEFGLKGLNSEKLNSVIIAYEPVWAIGTGKTATAEQAEEAHKHIRDKVSELFGIETANSIRILYGGSVKPENISLLMSKENIDGALVGGASLKADSFASIVKFERE